jgi:hypothetical protein
VLPAENKWFTRVVVAAAVIEALAHVNLTYPEVGKYKLKQLAAAKRKLLKDRSHFAIAERVWVAIVVGSEAGSRNKAHGDVAPIGNLVSGAP